MAEVKRNGGKNWNKVAEKVPGRSAKSCRLRWVVPQRGEVGTARSTPSQSVPHHGTPMHAGTPAPPVLIAALSNPLLVQCTFRKLVSGGLASWSRSPLCPAEHPAGWIIFFSLLPACQCQLSNPLHICMCVCVCVRACFPARQQWPGARTPGPLVGAALPTHANARARPCSQRPCAGPGSI